MSVTESDKQLALKIANSMDRVYVKAGLAREHIADYVAIGIARGRQQGLEAAASVIERECAEIAQRVREISN